MTILQYADVFLAEGPDPAVADKLQLFGQFVGSWDVAVTNHRPDGSSETIPPEWHFASALGGRAIQDVWIAPSRADRVSGRDGDWGATLRRYDDSIDAWRSTWIGPRNRVVMPFLARSVGDYKINPNSPMRHAAQREHDIGELLDLLGSTPEAQAS
jgi:hypothetical protein